MDGKNLNRNRKKPASVEKMERFEALKDNEIGFEVHSVEKHGNNPLGQGNYDIRRLQNYNILQEKDFESASWDVEELLKEQEQLRSFEGGEQSYLNYSQVGYNQAKILAKQYGGVSKKDRRKEFREHSRIINEEIVKVTAEYRRKKAGLSAKDRLKYEKKIIGLNAEAREHFLTATMKNKAQLKKDLAKNELRRDYRLLRMYFMHLQDKSLSAKDRTKLETEFEKLKAQIREKAKEVWGAVAEAKDFDWTQAIGAYEAREAESKHDRKVRKKALEDEQERNDQAAFEKEVDKEVEIITFAVQQGFSDELVKGEEFQKSLNMLHGAEKHRDRVKVNRTAREYFLLTGIWDPETKDKKEEKDKKAEAPAPQEGWFLWQCPGLMKGWLATAKKLKISDEVFVSVMKNINESYKENYAAFMQKGKEEGFTRRFLRDFSEHVERNFKYNPKKKYVNELGTYTRITVPETKEARVKRRRLRAQAEEVNRLMGPLEKLGYPELEELCAKLYTELFKMDERSYYRKAANLSSVQAYESFKEKRFMEMIKPIEDMARRMDHVTKILELDRRGPAIYKSPAVKKLIVTDILSQDGVEEALVAQVKNTDRMMRRMADLRFGAFAGQVVYDELRVFLGDKALFADYRTVKDLSERFMSGLSLTSIKAARVHQDYLQAYEEVFGGEVDPLFDRDIQEYLNSLGLQSEKEGKRKKSIIKNLKSIKTVVDIWKGHCDGLSLTRTGWKSALKGIKNLLGNIHGRILEVPKEDFIKSFDSYFSKLVKEDSKNREERMSFKAWNGEQESAEEKQRRDVTDFSFRAMLTGDGLLGSQEVLDVVRDPELRLYLADHLEEVIIGNPELIARFPFMEKVKNLDMLEELHYSEFEQLKNYLKGNLTEDGMAERLQSFLGGKELIPAIKEMKKRVLLTLFESRTDEEEMKRIVRYQTKLANDTELVKRGRLYYKVCNLDMQRDGKIRMRYEDMPDRKKGFFQRVFRKNAADYQKRIASFDQANAAWRRLEQTGSAAVAQMKRWIAEAFKAEKSEDILKNLESLAEMLSWDAGASKKKWTEADKKLAAGQGLSDAEEFRKLIRQVVSGLNENKKPIAKKGKKEIDEPKIADVKDFILEMAFCDSQDVLFNHGGFLQGGVFRFYGQRDRYREWLVGEAQKAQKNLNVLDKHLKKYDDHPTVQRLMRDKMMPTYLTSRTEVHERKKALEEKIPGLRSELEKVEKNYEGEPKDTLERVRNSLSEIETKLKAMEGEGGMIVVEIDEYKRRATEYNRRREQAHKDDEKLQTVKKALEKDRHEFDTRKEKKVAELRKRREKIKKTEVKKLENFRKERAKILSGFKEEEAALKQRENEARTEEQRISDERNWYREEGAIIQVMDARLKGNHEYYDELKKEKVKVQKEKEAAEEKYGQVEQQYLDKLEEFRSVTEELSHLDRALEDEYWKNSISCGFDNLDQLAHYLTDAVEKDGTLKNDAKIIVERLEARRKKLEQYGDGELAVFWDAFINNDNILGELLSEDETTADQCIRRLYKRLAPLGAVLNEEYSYIARYYIEDKIDVLLDPNGETEEASRINAQLKKIAGEIPEKLKQEEERYRRELDAAESEEEIRSLEEGHAKNIERIKGGERTFWQGEVNSYRTVYFNQKKRGNTSIYDKLAEAATAVQDDLTKHMLYEDEGTAKQFKDRKAKYRKWWFRTSKNTGVELIAQKHKQTKYQIAVKNAGEIIMNMQDVILSDEDAMSKMINTGSAKDYYVMLTERYLANDETAEKAFLRNILRKEEGKKVSSEEEIEKALAELPEEKQKDISDLLILFKKHVEKAAVAMKSSEFDAAVGNYAEEFRKRFREQQEDFAKTKDEDKARYDKKLDERRLARGEVMSRKAEGQRHLKEKLFGGYWDALREFGERKQSVVYDPPKARLAKKVKSKGEATDKEWLDAARAEFALDKAEQKKNAKPYPEILAHCLDEYCRLNHGYLKRIDRTLDKISNWFSSEDEQIKTDINIETGRLKRIYRVADTLEIPEEAMDLFLVYAARFVDKPKDLAYTDQVDAQVKQLAKEFLPYYEKLTELDEISVNDHSLKHALIDAREKSRSFLFVKKEKTQEDFVKFRDMVDAQIAYFPYADRAFAILDEETRKNKKVALMKEVDQKRFSNAIKEYFTDKILQEATSGARFDAEQYRKEVRECLSDRDKREAMLLHSESISSEEYEQQQQYAGEMTEQDFIHAMAATRKDDFLKEYNKLNETERKIFALALYVTKDTQTGTQQVVFAPGAAVNKEERAQLLNYLKNGSTDFKVDYTRAIRAITTVHKRTKVSGDSEAFKAALRYVERIKRRREQLRPRDYKRMSDSYGLAGRADELRIEAIGDKTDNYAKNKEAMNKLKITDRKGFFELVDKTAKEDQERKDSRRFFHKMSEKYKDFKNNKGIDTIKKRLEKLDGGKKSLLIYILQDRTVLDYSTAGKDEKTRIVPHVNAEKRFKLFEELMTEEGRLKALALADAPDMARNAMKTLLSFQVRDDKELSEGKLTADDYDPASLYREEAIDWMLMANALDFLDELEREQRRLLAVRQAPLRILNPTDEIKKSKAWKFRDGRGVPYTLSSFEDQLHSAFMSDRKDYKDASKLYRGYMSLSPQQKVLFMRALQHRDLLDVSQRNLYKDILGLAERDFVNRKERDALIDEYIEKTSNDSKSFEMDEATFGMAMLNLLSTQVNDDMSFEKVEGSNWAYKNLNVNNQPLVFDTRSDTIIDWKLFERALQLVTRTEAEKKASAGDEALYQNLGDTSQGEMQMDRSFLRRNLHHTGSRFMRFLAREGYAQVEDTLGLFDTVAGMAEFVVSTKTANFLHEQANLFRKEEEEGKEEEKKEEEKKEEEKKEEEEKTVAGFLQTLATAAGNAYEQYNKLKEMVDEVKETYSEYKETFVEDEASKEEQKKLKKAEEEEEAKNKTDLDRELEEIKLPEETKFFDVVKKQVGNLPGYREMLDQYLKDNPKYLKMADAYCEKIFRGKIGAEKLGEWYTAGTDWVSETDEKLLKSMPKGMQESLDKLLNGLDNMGEILTIVSGYLTPAIGILGDFKNMWESYQNIKELKEKKEKAGEAAKQDDELIAGVDVDEKTRQLIEMARDNNYALLEANNSMVGSIEGRKIVDSVANVVNTGLELGGIEGVETVIKAAADFVKFIYKCMSDKKALLEYYEKGGAGDVERIMDGQKRMDERMQSWNGKSADTLDITRNDKNDYKISSDGLDQLQHGLGFERREEFADFLRLNMVNSLLFSASKYNPLQKPRLLATCALTILGLESEIGKTDAETAEKIFAKLKD
ncbi:MAG: hypothetical protein K6E50_11800 [Lachnospiraceae bacterium]|nr:hypothetical protein [Lachnospiraceae bacterium]